MKNNNPCINKLKNSHVSVCKASTPFYHILLEEYNI